MGGRVLQSLGHAEIRQPCRTRAATLSRLADRLQTASRGRRDPAPIRHGATERHGSRTSAARRTVPSCGDSAARRGRPCRRAALRSGSERPLRPRHRASRVAAPARGRPWTPAQPYSPNSNSRCSRSCAAASGGGRAANPRHSRIPLTAAHAERVPFRVERPTSGFPGALPDAQAPDVRHSSPPSPRSHPEAPRHRGRRPSSVLPAAHGRRVRHRREDLEPAAAAHGASDEGAARSLVSRRVAAAPRPRLRIDRSREAPRG